MPVSDAVAMVLSQHRVLLLHVVSDLWATSIHRVLRFARWSLAAEAIQRMMKTSFVHGRMEAFNIRL